MPAILWQTELRVSVIARRWLRGIQILLILLLLLPPWTSLAFLARFLLVCLAMTELQITLRNWQSQSTGWLQINNQQQWLWKGQCWQLKRQLGWLPFAVHLTLVTSQAQISFWLLRDSMTESDWRWLRMYWLTSRERHWQ